MKRRNSLLTSILALLLCVSMLLGTTFAWFTDSATSGNNLIQSGNLDIEMYWSDKLLAADSDEWQNADGTPIFTYDKWEPGYTEVRYIKVKNAGSLALQWRLFIEAEGAVGELAEVIEVYYVNPITSAADDLSDLTSVGVLTDVLNEHKHTSGILLPAGETSAVHTVGETILAVAFHMDENAGNKYQGKSVGDGFAVNLIATQYTYESDAFGDKYDELAQWPNNVTVSGQSASAAVTADADNKVASTVSISSTDGKIFASVPAGVKLANGANKLTLSVNDVADSKANITINETEATMSIDVHMDGVAADNDVVMAIAVKKLLPAGLNMGNYRLYHVENGQTVEMTLLVDGATPAHNNFKYDPATGDAIFYLKSFSELALVASKESVWTGNFDYSWYNATGTESDPYIIANADQLAGFGAIVGGMNGQKQDSFTGKYVKLVTDINLGYNGTETYNKFYPIGYTNTTGSYTKTEKISVTSTVNSFEGIFDGNGNVISNFYQNTWDMFGDYNDGYSGTPNHYKDAMGLFGYVFGGTVKNLTVKDFSSDGEFTPTGVIAAYASNSTFENIAIINCNPRVYNTGNGGIVGIGGNSDDPESYGLTFENITVDNTNKITALWGSWDVACGGLVGMFRGAGHAYMTNCHVSAQIDVFNDVCGNYQYYWYRYAGMLIGTNKNMITDANGYTVPETEKFHAENCTVHFGDWNNYYYCELVANSLASYTHDHQMSRLTQVAAVNGTTITTLEGEEFTVSSSGRYNYVVVTGDHATENATCYHFVDGKVWNHADAGTETVNGVEGVLKEDKQHIFLPFNQLFTGYGWGVKHIPIYNDASMNPFENVLILEREVADSVTKFEYADNVKNTYTIEKGQTGYTVRIGDLFKSVAGLDEKTAIDGKNVQVFISRANGVSWVVGSYQANEENWEDGTLTFSRNGTAVISITDYNYCVTTILDIQVTDHNYDGDTFVGDDNDLPGFDEEDLFG